MISPVKHAVGPDYDALERRIGAAVHIRFGLPAEIPVTVKKQIKRADRLSAWMEATEIAGFSVAEADRFFGKPDPANAARFRHHPAPADRDPRRLYRPAPRADGRDGVADGPGRQAPRGATRVMSPAPKRYDEGLRHRVHELALSGR